ncbi:MAG: DHH family phosphoesterase, partial [Candidatus Micrarchaeota archaeon]
MEKLTKISELRANTPAAVEGEVFRTSEARGAFVYFVRDETGGVEMITGGEFAPRGVITASGKVRERDGALQLVASEAGVIDKARAARLSEEIKKSIDARAQPLESKLMIEDEVTRKIELQLREAARVVREAVLTARPILLRHHGDADGIAGALALAAGIAALLREEKFSAEMRYSLFRAHQTPSAIYEKEDALRDINTLRIVGGKPLVILLDFGANEESRDALEVLKGAEFETIITDHHPTRLDARKFASHYISPWNFEGGSSDYTAGFLACELAKKIGIVDARDQFATKSQMVHFSRSEKLEIGLLEKASLIGDKSKLLRADDADEKEKKCALVLDFLGAHKKFEHTLEFYEKVLGNERLFNSLHSQATERIEQAKKLAKES